MLNNCKKYKFYIFFTNLIKTRKK